MHVTLKMRPPYSEWGVEERARDAGFRTVECLHFDQKAFPGYRHRTTEKDAKTFVAAAEQEVIAYWMRDLTPQSHMRDQMKSCLQNRRKILISSCSEIVTIQKQHADNEGRM